MKNNIRALRRRLSRRQKEKTINLYKKFGFDYVGREKKEPSLNQVDDKDIGKAAAIHFCFKQRERDSNRTTVLKERDAEMKMQEGIEENNYFPVDCQDEYFEDFYSCEDASTDSSYHLDNDYYDEEDYDEEDYNDSYDEEDYFYSYSYHYNKPPIIFSDIESALSKLPTSLKVEVIAELQKINPYVASLIKI